LGKSYYRCHDTDLGSTGFEKYPDRGYTPWHEDVEEEYKYRLHDKYSFRIEMLPQLHGARECPDDRTLSEVCGKRDR